MLHLGSLAYDFTSEKLNTWLKEKEARLANDKWGREELDEKRASDQKHLKKLTPMSGMCSQVLTVELGVPVELVAIFDIGFNNLHLYNTT